MYRRTKDGVGFISFSRYRVTAHLLQCPAREIYCTTPGCGKVMPAASITEHQVEDARRHIRLQQEAQDKLRLKLLAVGAKKWGGGLAAQTFY